jgi:hypothetical protein
MKYWLQMGLMMAALSFVAAFILCIFDSFPWRKFQIFSSSEEDSGGVAPDQRLPWWQEALCIALVAPLAVIIIPVALGAVPAMILYVSIARFRWIRRAVRRLLRRRGIIFSWLLSFFVAPFVLIRRLLRYVRFRHNAA